MSGKRILFALILVIFAVPSLAETPGNAVLLDIQGPIGPATSNFVARGITKAGEHGAALVILRMDTPGGLDTSMREIIRAILASPVPVVSYVAPSGARAASAGTYISYASHVAAMAPGTNLGAATPVQIGAPGLPSGEPDRDKGENKGDSRDKSGKPSDASGPPPSMSDKAVSDAVAYIRSLAQMRGRNVEWAAKAVR